MYVPLNGPNTHEHAADVALAVGQMLERQHPDRVTTTMAKAVRPGKIFIDWSRNTRRKTTIGVYSLQHRAASAHRVHPGDLGRGERLRRR